MTEWTRKLEKAVGSQIRRADMTIEQRRVHRLLLRLRNGHMTQRRWQEAERFIKL